VEVVELDMSKPFSAARARNAGFERLNDKVKFIQFVDGDCEIVTGWIERARQELEQRPDVAVVCGRRRERHPEASIYNRIADIEWDTPIGEAQSCGGDSMMRADAFAAAGGFDSSVVAGEEPELCQRLRANGWKILRINAEMTLHDAAMVHMRQWWRRSVRGGYGTMDVASRFGSQGLFKAHRAANAFVGVRVPGSRYPRCPYRRPRGWTGMGRCDRVIARIDFAASNGAHRVENAIPNSVNSGRNRVRLPDDVRKVARRPWTVIVPS